MRLFCCIANCALAVGVFLSSACNHRTLERASRLETELGPGNELVARRFEANKPEAVHCGARIQGD